MSARCGPEDGPVRPEDLDVTLAVRRDLGPGHDPAVVAEFLDRVGGAIDARVDARVEAHRRSVPPIPPMPPVRHDRGGSLALSIVSIVAAIPITAVTLGVTDGSVVGLVLMLVAWLAIVAVNVSYNRQP